MLESQVEELEIMNENFEDKQAKWETTRYLVSVTIETLFVTCFTNF
jgi:hypothetical protein